MSENPFDLKLQPDWVKDADGPNPYARYEGQDRDGDARGGFRDRRDGAGRGDRGGGGRRAGGNAPRGDRPPNRGSNQRPPAGGGGGQGQGNFQRRDDRGPRQDGPPRDRFQNQGRQEAELPPAPVFVEFIPEPACINAIARQIKETGHAYPLFDLARLFLARPDRHRVKIAATEAAQPLYQCGDESQLALDSEQLERRAFQNLRDKYYVAETKQTEEIKGQFTRVARCRLSGVLLGPTNHHSYQSAVRRLYDQRFSRRMSFPDYQRNIESVADPEAVEAWKEQARSVKFFRLRTDSAASEAPAEVAPAPIPEQSPAAELSEAAEVETPPSEEAVAEAVSTEAEAPTAETPAAPAYDGPIFETEADCEKHFRETYLPQLIQKKTTVEVAGEISRRIPDQRLAQAIRVMWEKQRGYPGQMMFHLRRALSAQGLHVFKHRKQRIYITSHRPTLFNGDLRSVSATVASILSVIAEHPQTTRAQLAAKLLQAEAGTPEFNAQKATLAADFHWLVRAGHVIEFQDGKLDLPLPREAGSAGPAGSGKGKSTATEESEMSAEEVAPSENEPTEAPAPVAESPAEPLASDETPAP